VDSSTLAGFSRVDTVDVYEAMHFRMNTTRVTVLLQIFLACLALISCGQKQVALPVILNASETARAGDVVYLQGSGFGQSPQVQFRLDKSLWKILPLLSVGSGIVTAQIPLGTKPDLDLFAMRVSGDGKVWSDPVLINRAVVMHFASSEVVPGGEVRVFGRKAGLRFLLPSSRLPPAMNYRSGHRLICFPVILTLSI